MMSRSSFWKLRSVTGHLFANSDYDLEYFLKISFLFSKHSRFYLPDSYIDPQVEQSILVMIRQKLEWNFTSRLRQDWAKKNRRDWYESLAVIHGPKEKKKKTQGSQRVIVRSLNLSSSTNQRVLKNLFPRTNIATVLHFAVFMYVDVQLQVGQAAARGQRRKAVIRDISGVDHRRVTNLSASFWFAGERYCTVFRHVMQLSLLVLC